MVSDQDKKLQERVQRQAQRMHKAEHERKSLLAETLHVSSLGLMFVAPVIAGAYLGRWLDEMQSGYSMRWTLSLILCGVAIGIYNVWHNVRD